MSTVKLRGEHGRIRKTLDPTDILEKRFGRLVVLSINKYYRNKYYYNCICDCGTEKVIRRDALVNHITESCGCKNREINSNRKIHGMYKTKFYKTLENMKSRCLNPNHNAYKNYGGRGITICDRWLGKDGFIHFMEDMYEDYLKQAAIYGEENISIDRINNDGNYEPSNCRWVPRQVQDNNKSTNVIINYNGEELTLKQLNDKYAPDIKYGTLVSRVNRCDDIDVSELLREVKPREEHIYTYNGETLPLAEIVSKYGDIRISYSTVLSRIRLGWDLKRALHELPPTHNGKKVTSPISFREPGCICPISFGNVTVEDNRSKNKYYYKGEELSITQLVEKYADPRLTKEIVRDRINKQGWPIETALTEIPRMYKGQKVIRPISFR